MSLAHPLLMAWPTTQACALTGNQTSDPLVRRPALNPLSHTSQGSACPFNFNPNPNLYRSPGFSLCAVVSSLVLFPVRTGYLGLRRLSPVCSTPEICQPLPGFLVHRSLEKLSQPSAGRSSDLFHLFHFLRVHFPLLSDVQGYLKPF